MTMTDMRATMINRLQNHRSWWCFGICVLLAVSCQLVSRPVLAADPLDRPITLDIPAETSLEDALIEWGTKAGMALMINTPTVAHQTTRAIRGTFPAAVALTLLLRDSGLVYSAEGGRIHIIPSTALVRSARREESEFSAAAGNAELFNSSTPRTSRTDAEANEGNLQTSHMEEVLVTAEKHTERLQDVPAAISAISGATLEAMGAESFTDYARTVPGLTFTDSGVGQEKPVIRGVNASVGADTVGYYIGEILIPTNPNGAAVNPDLIDIDRMEILRGPQGTLYGSGSIGGTIRLIPKAPQLSKFEGSIRGEGVVVQGADGPSPGGEADLILNVPIVEDRAAVRGAFWYRNVGGYITRTWSNAGTNGVAVGPAVGQVGNLPDEHTWGFRGTGLLQATENLSLSAMILFQNQRFDGFEDLTGGATNPSNRLVQNLISDVSERQEFSFTLYSITASYDFRPFNFTSATGYSTVSHAISEEGTSLLNYYFGAPPFASLVPTRGSGNTFTEEARLATSEKLYGLDAVLGIFYSQNNVSGSFAWKDPQYNKLVANNDSTNPLYAVNDNLYSNGGGGGGRELAEFGEITYHFTDALKAMVGLRHFEISSNGTQWQDGLFATGNDIPSYTPVAAESHGTVYKGNIAYNVTPDAMAYAQYAEGFRPGLGNPPVPQGADCTNLPSNYSEVQPDSIKTYEIGVKTSWLERSLNVNAAVYRTNWTNIQQEVFLPCGYGYLTNLGDAVIKGAELEVSDQFTKRLSGGFSGSYIRAELQEGLPFAGALAGDQIAAVPNWQFALNLETTYPILQSNDGFARVDYQYTGSSWGAYNRLCGGVPCATYADEANGVRDPTYKLETTRLLSFRTGIRSRSWELAVSGTNLLNESARQSIDPWGGVTIQIPGRPRYVVTRPRTFMINATYKF